MTERAAEAYPEPNEAKFRELILYLAQKSEADPKFGATKLNKLLFFCDFLAFRSLGASVTGQTYQKLPFGPAPRALKPVCEQMSREGSCVFRDENHFGYTQQRLIALREPNLEQFSGEEINLIRDVLAELWNSNGSEVSELSHLFLGWQVAAAGESIPYETILLSPPRPLDDEEQDWARQVAETHLESHPTPAEV